MKKLLIPLITAICLICPVGIAAETDNCVVTLKDGAAISREIEKEYDLIPVTEAEHGIYTAPAENAGELEDLPEVDDVREPVYYTLSASFNDPFLVQGSQWAVDALNMPYAWNLLKTKDHATPTIVVIDTGYAFDHPDAGSVKGGRDYVGGGKTSFDYETHGTECAGVIGAAADNGIGIAGVYDGCRIIVLSIFEQNANGENIAEDTNITAAIYDAVDVYHADVISMSFGGGYSAIVEEAVNYAYENGAILVAAAGNAGAKNSPLEYPAAFDRVIGVANMNASLRIEPTSTRNESVFISAPGANIVTLVNPNSDKTPGKLYGGANGTSLATPFVSALAAIARSYEPGLDADAFQNDLRQTATDLETPGYDIRSGYGLVNYEALLEKVMSDTTSFAIGSEEELSQFRDAVNGGLDAANGYLTTDIDVPADFAPITEEYNGTFDGGGHTLRGLKKPLFGIVGETGVVKKVSAQGEISGGGLIAEINRGKIMDCVTEGAVTGPEAGGVCAVNSGGRILGCLNRAEVRGDLVGGIAAKTENGGKIGQCGNVAAVTSPQNGAAGICAKSARGTDIVNCYNTGAISGTRPSGGIVAEGDGSALHCFYAKESVSGGNSDRNIIAKDGDFMKTRAFLLMLNEDRQYFNYDEADVNGGYPLPGSEAEIKFFRDVYGGDWFANAVYSLGADEIVSGRGNHFYHPNATITRAEFIKILAGVAGANLYDYDGASKFKDVSADQWYTEPINWAAENNLAFGKTADQFCPHDNVTREEICCFLMRYIRGFAPGAAEGSGGKEFTDSGDISHWAREDVIALTKRGVINGFPDRTFRPKKTATRAEAAMMIEQMRKSFD